MSFSLSLCELLWRLPLLALNKIRGFSGLEGSMFIFSCSCIWMIVYSYTCMNAVCNAKTPLIASHVLCRILDGLMYSERQSVVAEYVRVMGEDNIEKFSAFAKCRQVNSPGDFPKVAWRHPEVVRRTKAQKQYKIKCRQGNSPGDFRKVAWRHPEIVRRPMH